MSINIKEVFERSSNLTSSDKNFRRMEQQNSFNNLTEEIHEKAIDGELTTLQNEASSVWGEEIVRYKGGTKKEQTPQEIKEYESFQNVMKKMELIKFNNQWNSIRHQTWFDSVIENNVGLVVYVGNYSKSLILRKCQIILVNYLENVITRAYVSFPTRGSFKTRQFLSFSLDFLGTPETNPHFGKVRSDFITMESEANLDAVQIEQLINEWPNGTKGVSLWTTNLDLDEIPVVPVKDLPSSNDIINFNTDVENHLLKRAIRALGDDIDFQGFLLSYNDKFSSKDEKEMIRMLRNSRAMKFQESMAESMAEKRQFNWGATFIPQLLMAIDYIKNSLWKKLGIAKIGSKGTVQQNDTEILLEWKNYAQMNEIRRIQKDWVLTKFYRLIFKVFKYQMNDIDAKYVDLDKINASITMLEWEKIVGENFTSKIDLAQGQAKEYEATAKRINEITKKEILDNEIRNSNKKDYKDLLLQLNKSENNNFGNKGSKKEPGVKGPAMSLDSGDNLDNGLK